MGRYSENNGKRLGYWRKLVEALLPHRGDEAEWVSCKSGNGWVRRVTREALLNGWRVLSTCPSVFPQLPSMYLIPFSLKKSVKVFHGLATLVVLVIVWVCVGPGFRTCSKRAVCWELRKDRGGKRQETRDMGRGLDLSLILPSPNSCTISVPLYVGPLVHLRRLK